MESTMNFVAIIIIVFGILQIILFFKMWGMTNDVSKIANKLDTDPIIEDKNIIRAQIFALNGDKEESFKMYQESFYKNVINLFNKTIDEFGDENNLCYQERNKYYESKYNKIVNYYSERINKIEKKIDTERFNTYEKVHSVISKS